MLRISAVTSLCFLQFPILHCELLALPPSLTHVFLFWCVQIISHGESLRLSNLRRKLSDNSSTGEGIVQAPDFMTSSTPLLISRIADCSAFSFLQSHSSFPILPLYSMSPQQFPKNHLLPPSSTQPVLQPHSLVQFKSKDSQV